jgi:formylglycine-generating enzyme required for sulfatase activity
VREPPDRGVGNLREVLVSRVIKSGWFMRGLVRIASGQSIGLVLAGAVAFAGAFWFRLPQSQRTNSAALLEEEIANAEVHPDGLTAESFAGMVLIRGGEFVMGSDAAGAWPDEKPIGSR